MTKELSHVMLELHNVRMKPSNMRKKIRKPSNVKKKTITYDSNITKEPSNVMLELHNIRMKQSNVRTK